MTRILIASRLFPDAVAPVPVKRIHQSDIFLKQGAVFHKMLILPK